jgi:hypothetical protein
MDRNEIPPSPPGVSALEADRCRRGLQVQDDLGGRPKLPDEEPGTDEGVRPVLRAREMDRPKPGGRHAGAEREIRADAPRFPWRK